MVFPSHATNGQEQSALGFTNLGQAKFFKIGTVILSRQLAIFIDTSLKGICLGIADLASRSDEFLWKVYNPDKFGSASVLTDGLYKALSQLECKTEDLHNVIVSVGPGSFTGIKVGLSWSYGLGVTNPNTVYLGLSSFRELALELTRPCTTNSGAKQTENPLVSWVFLPATKTTGYACRVTTAPPGLADRRLGAKPSLQKAVVSAINAQDIVISETSGRKVALADIETAWIIGSWKDLQSGLTSRGLRNENIKIYETDEDFALISHTALRAMLIAAKSRFPDHFSSLRPKPNYLRQSLVEEKAQKNK